MKIEELYSKLAEHKPAGAGKEGKEWSKGVLKALCDWKGTSFSDLCKAIGYDELDDSIKSYLETYFKGAKDGTLKAGGKGDFANQWIEWNKMIKDNKNIKEASNSKPENELKEDGCKEVENIVSSLAVGLGEQIENAIRKKREEAEEEAAALEDAEKYLNDMKESRKKEIEKEKERVAGIAAKEKKLQFGNGDVNFKELVEKLYGIYGRKLSSDDTVQKWFNRAMFYADEEKWGDIGFFLDVPIEAFIKLNQVERNFIKEKKLYLEMLNYCSKYGALKKRLPKADLKKGTYDKENISSKDAKELAELFRKMNEYAQKIRENLNKQELKPKYVKLSKLIEDLNNGYNRTSNKDGAKWFDKALRSVVLYLEKNQKDHYSTLIECFYDINEEEREILNEEIKKDSGSSVFDEMSEGITRNKDKMIAGCKLAIVLANEFKNNKDTDIEEEQAELVKEAFMEIKYIVSSVLQTVYDRIKENVDKKPLDKVYSKLAGWFKRKDSPKTDEEWFKGAIAALENYGDSKDKVRALVGDDKFDVGDWKELFAQEWHKEFCSKVEKTREVIKKVKERSDAGKNIPNSDYSTIYYLFEGTFYRGQYIDKLLEYKRLNTAVKVEDVSNELGKMYNKTGTDNQEWFKNVMSSIKSYSGTADETIKLYGEEKFSKNDLKNQGAIDLCKRVKTYLGEKKATIEKVAKWLNSNGKESLLGIDYDSVKEVFKNVFDEDSKSYLGLLLRNKELNTAVNVKDIFDEIGKMYNKTGNDNQKWCKEVIEKLGDKNSFDEIASIAGYNFDDYDYVRKISPNEDYHEEIYSKAKIINKTNSAVENRLGRAKASIKDIKDWAEKDKVLGSVSELIKGIFSIYFDARYTFYGVGYMSEILEECKNSFEKKFGFFLDKDLNKNLDEYYDRFKKFVSVQDTFLNDKKDGFTTCDRLVYDYRKKVLPGLDERLKRFMKTKEDVVDGLKEMKLTEEIENFKKVKGFKDFESNNIQALKLGSVVEVLLKDGVAGNRGEDVKDAAYATIGTIVKSLRVTGIDKTDEGDFSKFTLKANAQGKDLHGEDIKRQVNHAIQYLVNGLGEFIDSVIKRFVENKKERKYDFDNRHMVDTVLEEASDRLDGTIVTEVREEEGEGSYYQTENSDDLRVKLSNGEYVTLREYGYKEKSSTATWIRNLSNEIDSMLESQINPEDKIKRFKKKLLDIPKMSSSKASINNADVKKDIKNLTKKLDKFLEEIKGENKYSIGVSTERNTYTEGEGEEKKEIEIDKEHIVIALHNMIFDWGTDLGKNGNPVDLQAGTIYDTLRKIVVDDGIKDEMFIANYRWKKGSKTAEWLNKIEDDIVKKSKKLDPMEYLTNFRKNVNAFPSFTFKKAAVKFDEVQEAIEGLNTALDHRIEQLAARLVFEINSALKSEENFRDKLVGICNDIRLKKFQGYGRYFLIGSENRKKLDALINSRTPDSTLAALNVFEKSFNKYLKNIFEKNGKKVPTEEITLDKTSEKEVDKNKVKLSLDTAAIKKSLEEKAITTTKKGTKDERTEGLKGILDSWTKTINAWTGVDGLELAKGIQEGISANRRDWGSSGETQKWLMRVSNSCPESVKKKYNPVQILEEFRKAVSSVPKFTFKEAAIKNSEVKEQIDDLVKSIKAKKEEFQKEFEKAFEEEMRNRKSFEKSNPSWLMEVKNGFISMINKICSDEAYGNKNYFEEGTPMYVAADNFRDILKDIESCNDNTSSKYKKCVKKLEKSWKELKKAINKGVMISLNVDLPEYR